VSYELQTNDPRHPAIKVTIVANVKPLPAYVKRITTADIAHGEKDGPFHIWPTSRPAITAEPGERLIIPLRLRPIAQQSVALKPGPDVPDSWKLRREAGGDYWLDIPIDTTGGSGTHVARLIVDQGENRSSEIRVQLILNIPNENIVVTPRELHFGEVALSGLSGATQRFGIRKLVGSFRIKTLSSTLPFLKLEPTTMVDGSNYRIKITVDPSKAPKAGDYSGTVVVETDEGRKIEVPVKMRVVDR
jgi:hypothetical protein